MQNAPQSLHNIHRVSFQSVIEHANRYDASPRVLISTLESRPELARWVLDTINSDRFSLGVPVNTLRQAMVTVGQNTFRQLVLVTASLPLSCSL
jgi:HD-like signal output (HDOD) protein